VPSVDTFVANFVRRRFEYAALVFDCTKATRSAAFRWHARVFAIPLAILLLAIPFGVLWAGEESFGNRYAFGITLLLWPVILEAAGWERRQADASDEPPVAAARKFDMALFVGVTVIGLIAPGALHRWGSDLSGHGVWRGILWGVAVAAGIDFSRSLITFIVSSFDGWPLYGPRARLPVGAP
jgi:hypothetical protein